MLLCYKIIMVICRFVKFYKMKKFFLTMVFLSAIVPIFADVIIPIDTIRIDGVLYKRYDKTPFEVDAFIDDKTNREVIKVLSKIKMSDKEYPVVSLNSNISTYFTKEIILPTNIKSVHIYNFPNLEKITLPDSLRHLTISNCGVKSITVPETIETLTIRLCDFLEEVNIPNTAKALKIVSFYESSLKKLILPNYLITIETGAFWNCSNLQSITLPDKVTFEEIIYDSNSDPFSGCVSLEKVEGTTIKYPSYIFDLFPSNAPNIEKIPFFKKIPQIKSSFTYFAQERIMKEIEAWQKKKEYETSAQWQARVTEANRAKKVQEFTERAKQEYIAKYTKGTNAKALACNVGYYDADYGVFPITDEKFGTFYASVPQAEAQNFKNNFSSVKITPEFGIKDDHISVIAATFTLGDKVYRSAENFGNAKADKDIAINLPPLQINISGESSQPTMPTIKVDNSIDLQIPQTAASNTNTFAVIIGNENYTQVAKVPYANNDAKVFAEYCKKTLGLPEKNVKVYTDATFGTILEAINNISAIAKAYKGDLNVIFYYAGHGVPNESTGDAYLLPVDASGRQTEACYPLDRLYGELSGMQARSVVAFIDACFSGSERGDGMLVSARGVAIKAKNAQARGNMVVFTAATGDQTAYPYDEKGHGMFTYFLLKKLQETKGEATLGEIGNYVSEQVTRQSVVVNSKSQTPMVMPSATMADDWKNLKLK